MSPSCDVSPQPGRRRGSALVRFNGTTAIARVTLGSLRHHATTTHQSCLRRGRGPSDIRQALAPRGLLAGRRLLHGLDPATHRAHHPCLQPWTHTQRISSHPFGSVQLASKLASSSVRIRLGPSCTGVPSVYRASRIFTHVRLEGAYHYCATAIAVSGRCGLLIMRRVSTPTSCDGLETHHGCGSPLRAHTSSRSFGTRPYHSHLYPRDRRATLPSIELTVPIRAASSIEGRTCPSTVRRTSLRLKRGESGWTFSRNTMPQPQCPRAGFDGVRGHGCQRH